MKVKLAKKNIEESMALGSVMNDTLMALAEKDERIVVMDADLMGALKTKPFMKAFPERTINCGIQEGNMLGTAAGLSAEGYIPYVHTFAPFSTRRALDQIWVSCGYAKNNVKIIGSDPGVMAALNGGTHMSFEDIGIMRLMPDVTIIEPTDSTVLKSMLVKSKDQYGIFYIRLLRTSAIKIYEESSDFEIGKAVKLRDGKDLSILTGGICVYEALRACDMLEKKGIHASVLDMITIKPIDREAVIKEAASTGNIITLENHNILNGLGSAVAEIIAEEAPAKLVRMGINDSFGEVGPAEYLKERFGLCGEDIVKTVAEKFC